MRDRFLQGPHGHRLTILMALLAVVGTLAASTGVAQADSCSATITWSTLVTCFAAGTPVTLAANIHETSGSDPVLEVGSGEEELISLAGHSLDVDQGIADAPGIEVPAGTELFITDPTGSDGSLAATGGYGAAGIGGGSAENGQSVGTVEVEGDASVTATGGAYGAGIGGGAGATEAGGSLAGFTATGAATVMATGGTEAAGIGGAYGATDGGGLGDVTIAGTAEVTATGGQDAAGIGGGLGLSGTGGTGGNVTIEDNAVVTATGRTGGAGVGGGDSGAQGATGGAGGTVNVEGAATLAASCTGSTACGAGIGGGYGDGAGGPGATVQVTGTASVTASGDQGSAGIGGGASAGTGGAGGSLEIQNSATVSATGGIFAPGVGAGFGETAAGVGATTTVGSGATLTATAGTEATSFAPVYGNSSAAFGSLTNEGTLIIPSGSTLDVPNGTTAINKGELLLKGDLSGSGVVDNTGVIAPNGGSVANNGDCASGELCVGDLSFALSFNLNGVSGTTPSTQYVYAASLSDESADLASPLGLPAGPAPADTVFEGWYNAASGGMQVTDTTSIVTLFGGAPASQTAATLYAHDLQVIAGPSATSTTATGSASFAASASDDGDETLSVQWQSCPASDPDSCAASSSGWTDVSGATSDGLVLSDVPYADDGNEYRAVFSDLDGSVVTQPATLTVSQVGQAITFTPLSPSASAGTSATLTATGGASGEPIVFSVDPSSSPADACTVSGDTVTYAHIGTCVIDANQAGSANYRQAAEVSQTVQIDAVGTTVSLPAPAATVYGQADSVTATVVDGNGSSPSGAVQFTVDGQNLGSAVAVSNGTATSPNLGSLAPGSHTVTATYIPADTTVYTGASGSATAVVDQAGSTTSVSVGASSVTATVAAVAPGAGTPTGTVTFELDGQSIGTASLVNGTAALGYTVGTDRSHQVAAIYGGDSDFTGSSGSMSLAGPAGSPSIRAYVSSAIPKTRFGWYRSPVTVTFTCTTGGSQFTTPCPGPVVLRASKAAQSLTRTISVTDGKTATVVVSPVNIDTTKPKVMASGVKNGAVYENAPKVGCVGSDRVSGIAHCTVTTSRSTTGTVRYRVTATSRSGETSTVSGSYRVLGVYLEGASYRNGVFTIPTGRTYTIVVQGTGVRPRYVYGGPAPVAPVGGGVPFVPAGHDRWAIGVKLPDGLFSRYHLWDLGVEVATTLHVLAVRL